MGFVPVSLVHFYEGDVVERGSDAGFVVQFAPQGQSLFVEGQSVFVVAIYRHDRQGVKDVAEAGLVTQVFVTVSALLEDRPGGIIVALANGERPQAIKGQSSIVRNSVRIEVQRGL